jgi:hypothetical protein
MNIFVTNICPIKSAIFLDDKRVIKMILESAQMLSTALHTFDVKDKRIYKKTHLNHPCTVWVRKNKSNYMWLLKHFKALSDEYTRRFNKVHKSGLLYNIFLEHLTVLPDGDLTQFKNCTDRKHISDVFYAYELYLYDKFIKNNSSSRL